MKFVYSNAEKVINGEYVRAFMVYPAVGEVECHHTRSGVLWRSVVERTREGSSQHKRRGGYCDATNDFTDFQSFALWCNAQRGFLNKELNGKFWCLDKDIVIPFNKSYSEATCCFVPNELNCLFTYSSKARGAYPLGVNLDKRKNGFNVQGNVGGKRKYLGYFKDPMLAHIAYQNYKVEKIDFMISKYNGLVEDKVIQGLKLHQELILDDIKNGKETIR